MEIVVNRKVKQQTCLDIQNVLGGHEIKIEYPCSKFAIILVFMEDKRNDSINMKEPLMILHFFMHQLQ